jgi:hypothetical protein
VLTLYELTESEATLSQGMIVTLNGKRLVNTCWYRIPWHGSGTITEGVECSCEERKGTSLWPGRSTGSQVFLEGRVAYQHWEEFMDVISR